MRLLFQLSAITIFIISLHGCLPYKTVNITHYLEHPSADSGVAIKVDYSKYEQEYKGFDAVYLVKDFTMEQIPIIGILGGSTQKLSKVNHIKYVVLKPDEDWLSTFMFTVEKGTELVDLYAVMYTPEGEIKKYTIQDMRTTKLPNGDIEYKMAYPNVKKGTIIEEGWQILDDDIFSFENYNIQSSQPIISTTMRLVYPSNFDSQIKKIGENKTLPLITAGWRDDGTTVLTYTSENLPGIKDEPYSPYYRDLGYYFVSKATRVNGWQLKKSEWSDLSEVYKILTKFDYSDLNGVISDSTAKITKHCTGTLDKMDSIITWIQQNIKHNNDLSTASNNYSTYYGINYTRVLQSKLAFSGEINALARVMLKSAGIESDFVLLRDARMGYFDKDFVDFREFSFSAILAKIDGKTYLVFPSEPKIPTSYVPEFYQGQTAMQISSTGGYDFITLSPANCGQSESIQQYKLNIKEDGVVSVNETKIFKGSQAFFIREYFKDVKDVDMPKQMKKLLTYSDGDVKLIKHTIKNQENYKEPLEVVLEYTIDNLVTVTPDEVIFQTGGLFAPGSQEKEKFETNKRYNPIRIYIDDRLEKDITINYPKTWKLITELNNSQDSSSFGSVGAIYSTDTNTLSINMERLLKPASEPKEKIQNLISLIGSKSKLNIPTLVFKINQ